MRISNNLKTLWSDHQGNITVLDKGIRLGKVSSIRQPSWYVGTNCQSIILLKNVIMQLPTPSRAQSAISVIAPFLSELQTWSRTDHAEKDSVGSEIRLFTFGAYAV